MKWQYDENTGKPVEKMKGSGEFHARYAPPLCQTTGCPKGTPEEPRSLSPKNVAAYIHYLGCRATGRFPSDPLVTRHAAIIRAIHDEFDRDRQDRMLAIMARCP